MENHLKRVLNLVEKTGDTMVVVDKEGNEAFVVMDLDHYETLLGSQTSVAPVSQPNPTKDPDIWDVMQEAGEEGETWDIDQLSEQEFQTLEKQYHEFATKNVKEAIDEVKIPPKNKEDEEYGEEQFYLEPVE
ncbi:hypothetical protein HY626_01870 [Candidatus Uhrbacteria bacterium]|nr:hypothetical protein [Candidatus Uhrbacteria bacterium]